jgi:hypothetical protein
MATIFNRGFVQRSLPALLALILGFLVAPQPAVPSAIAHPGPGAAADLDATTRTTAAEAAVHTGHSTPTAPPPAEPAAPADRSAHSTEQISAGPHTLRAQVTVRTLGSRAPPSALA